MKTLNKDLSDFFSRHREELSEVTHRKVKRAGLMIQTPAQIFNQTVSAVQENCRCTDEEFLRDEFDWNLKQIISYWLSIEDKV